MAQILVVDDEEGIRAFVEMALRAEGHDVALAENGKRALERIEDSTPDLILLDMAMPEMDGWHFLEALYRRRIRNRTRVVIMSGLADIERDARNRSSAFLPKPFDGVQLLTAVEFALSHTPEAIREGSERIEDLAVLLARMDAFS